MSPAASEKLAGVEIFKALKATTLKARVAADAAKMKVSLTVPKTMQPADWLNELIAFCQAMQAIVAPNTSPIEV